MATRKKTPAFEEGLERLEKLVGQMEQGELALDELLKLYEEGMKLSRELTQKLEMADSRMMEVRLGRDGEPRVEQGELVRQQSLLDELADETAKEGEK